MAVVNALIVAAFFAVLPFTGGSIDTPATLFAVLLLTLLVTLYDRFRPYYVARRSGAERRCRRVRSQNRRRGHSHVAVPDDRLSQGF